MEDSRLLGPVIRNWFKQNGWPQSVSEGLAKAKGWETGPWASQISICMAGRLAPKPAFFVALGVFNQAIAERDFVGVTDRRLMDRLKAAEPLCHEDGVPWDATDFFACYVGALDPPVASEPQVLTQEQVDHWHSESRAIFKQLSLTLMASKGETWKLIAERLRSYGINNEDVASVQEIVSGFRDGSPEETTRLALKYPDGSLASAMQELLDENGGSSRRAKKLIDWRAELVTPVNYPIPELEKLKA